MTMLRYQKVAEHIKELLKSTDYAPGDRLPSERDLAATLGVNRLTVRRAVNNLIHAGLLEGNGTSGTRVAAPRMVRRVDIYRSVGVHRVITGLGGTPSNKMLHFQISTAGSKVADRLKIDEGDEVIVVRRVWSIDGTPFSIETSHLVSRLVPGLTADDLVSGQSLYALLGSRYGIETVNAERTITVAYVNEIEARLLDVEPGTAVLALKLVVETKDKQPIEYLSSINNPKLVVFRTLSADQEWRD
jgi:GntR family transcriptional regulator